MVADADGSASEGRLLAGYSGQVFLVLVAGTLVANLGRAAIPPLLPNIIDTLAITPAAAGIALTAFRLSFAVFQYPSGRMADALARSTAIVLGLIVSMVGFVILSSVTAYWMFVLATGVLGVGFAFFFVTQRVLLSDLFVGNRGRAFGLTDAGSRIGSILAAGLALVALQVGPWQVAFVPVALLLLLITGVFHLVTREPYQFGRFELPVGSALTRVFKTTEVKWLVVAYTLLIFTWEGLMSFLPTFLQVSKGFSPAFASGGFASLFAIGIVVQPLAGTVSDRWDRRTVAGVATLVSVLGLVVLLLATSTTIVILAILLFAAGTLGFTPVVQAYLLDVFAEETKGGDLGAFKTVYEGLSSAGPAYVGIVAGVASYSMAFRGFVVCLLASGVILFGLRVRDRHRPIRRT